MIQYKTLPYTLENIQLLQSLWKDSWQLCTIYDGKMFLSRIIKEERKARIVITDDTFDWFYKKYPNKKARKDAMIMWNRLKEAERELAFDWLERYLIYWKKKGIEKDFIPMPATWLNGRRWEDNLSETVQIAPNENIEKIRVEEEEERKNEQEKRAMNKRIADIKANPELWERLSNKALELMTEEQKADRNSIVFKSIFDARIRTIINQ